MCFNFLILGSVLSVCCVSAVNFDVNKVVTIKLKEDEQVEGSYFGYSILLQKGQTPVVIVGAPKQSSKTGGSVFSCDILNNNVCTKYSMAIGNNDTFNGNFLGSAIDGDDEAGKSFIACAPRKVTQVQIGSNNNYFLLGSCLYCRNSSSFLSRNIELNPLKSETPIGRATAEYYYDYAFAQAGIDIVYSKESSSIILGATGIKNWNGAIVTQSLKTLTDHKIIPRKAQPVTSENYEYLGYKVGYGKLSGTSFLFGGAPRANDLLGRVKLFKDDAIYRSFTGEEIGGYFGAAVLAQDVNNDSSDDLFVGAPTAAGATYEEGCVYFYKNAIGAAVKLTGKGKRGARFGTNIVGLGDIDLDTYKDVAIAAPFEDDGVGAVYIFMGTSDGIKSIYSQRLVPSLFPGYHFHIKGFGMGLSRGNDIDGNGHNDLAIGAYKSGHVIVIPTKSVLDFRTALEPNLTSITSNDSQITIKFCIYYKPRSNSSNLKSVDFQMKLTMDYRVKGPKILVENATAYSEATMCKQNDVKLEQSIVDLMPFQFSLNTYVIGDVYVQGTSTLDRSIPYSHGCGSDNICQTQILMEVFTKTLAITVGLHKVVNVQVSAENAGEPGYQCQLYMEVPKELELREERKCVYENSTHICPFASKFYTNAEKDVAFDVVAIHPTAEQINISFEIKCLGENIENKDTLILEVVTQNSPYIEGKSDPEDFENNDEIAEEDIDVELLHTFVVINFGPSPVKSDVYLLLPQVQIGDDDLFQLVEAKGVLRGIQVPCYPTNETKTYQKQYDVSDIVKASLNRTTVLDCFEEGSKCLELFCEGDYLYKSSETTKYTLKVRTKTNLLAKFFQKQPENKNIIAYVSSALLYNGTRIEGHSATLTLSSHSTRVPLWVYIVASVLGILLLCLIVFIFYKCHFFDRRYRDKMNGVRLMIMLGKILTSQAQELVLNLYEYFEVEKRNGGPLVPLFSVQEDRRIGMNDEGTTNEPKVQSEGEKS